jgi:hypothetical protein
MPIDTPQGVKLRPESDRVKAPNPAPQPAASPPPQPPQPLHADMPVIPGVMSTPPVDTSSKNVRLILVLAAVAIVCIVAWRLLPVRGTKATPNSATDADSAAEPAPVVSVAPATQAPSGPTVAATVDELSAPWSSKAFTFINPRTQEAIPAMVIHLPGGTASRADAYWAFSLNAPYQTCALELVTSISQLASKYAYRASHPMVDAACDGTIYDPLRVGSVPGGAFVRGEVVQGGGNRPPIAIDIRVEGRSLIADSIE